MIMYNLILVVELAWLDIMKIGCRISVPIVEIGSQAFERAA